MAADKRTIDELVAELRQRDTDPAYADAPILDAYARISKNPTTGEMEKTDRQLGDILRNMLTRHCRLGVILRDDNKSAWKKNVRRPAWEELLKRLKTGASNGLICWHLDRLMRQPRDLEKLIDLSCAGTVVGSCFGDHDINTSDGRFMLRMLTNAAVKASDDTSRRLKRANEARRAAGKMAPAPRSFGYGLTADALETERDLMRKAVRARLTGTALAEIVRGWNEDGVRTVRGGQWTVAQLGDTLNLARNAGLIEINGEIVGTAADGDPIISQGEFYGLRALKGASKKGRPASYPLTGILRCAQCSCAMASKPSGSKNDPRGRVRNYKCPSPTNRPGACGVTGIDAVTAEGYVKELVIKELCDPQHANMVARRSEALATAERELAELQRTAVELSARLGEGKFTLAQWDAFNTGNDARIAALTAERDALVSAGAGIGPARQMAETELRSLWDEATADEQRRLTSRAFPLGIRVLPRPVSVHHSKMPASQRIEPVTRKL